MEQNQGSQNPKMLDDGQLARAIYLRNMTGMKEILNLGEVQIGKRDTKEFKFFKKIVMDQFYNAMTELYAALEEKGVLMKCACGASIRQGYKPCEKCNGAGHCNTEEFHEWILGFEEYPDEHGSLPPVRGQEEEDPPQPQ